MASLRGSGTGSRRARLERGPAQSTIAPGCPDWVPKRPARLPRTSRFVAPGQYGRQPAARGHRTPRPRASERPTYSLSRSSALPKGGRPPVGDSVGVLSKDTTIPETVGSSSSTHFCQPGSETVARDRATSRTADGYGAGAWFAAQRSSTASTRPAAVSKSRDTLRR